MVTDICPLLAYCGRMNLFADASLNGSRFFLVAGLVEQGKHVLLVRLYAGLVKRIDAEHIAGDTASALEEI